MSDPEQRWTDRLHLRRITEADLDQVAALYTDRTPELAREAAQGHLADWSGDGMGAWAVERNGTLIGVAGLRFFTFHLRDAWDLSYRFVPHTWGKGYALETVEEALVAAQEHSARLPVVARTPPGDVHAFGLAERAGLTRRKDLDRDDLEVHVTHW